MQAIQIKTEVSELNAKSDEAEGAEELRAVRELTSLELSLVGGGTIAVAFQ